MRWTMARIWSVGLLGISALWLILYAKAQEPGTTVREKSTTVHEKVTTTTETETVTEAHGATRMAIFVKNRAGATLDDKRGALEDLVTAQVTNLGFHVISPQDTVQAVRSYLKTPPDQAIPGAELDTLLENNTSAQALARNMGANYMLVLSIATYGSQDQKLDRPDLGIKLSVTTYTMRAVYKILIQGASVNAGTVEASKRVQQSATLQGGADVVNDLLADVASQIGEKFEGLAVPVAPTDSEVQFSVACTVHGMTVPDVRDDDQGHLTIKDHSLKLELLNVTVELDGVVIGTAPGTFPGVPGLHKIRLSHAGYEDWTHTINIRDGLPLNVDLTLSNEGRNRWMEMAAFFSKLKREERMASAQEEAIRGYAQFLRQSGIRIDRRSDVKINTDQAPTVQQINVDQQNVASSVWP